MRTLHGIIQNPNIHYWTNTQGEVLFSFENKKRLLSFRNFDDAINYLWINNHKEAAREINKKIKGKKNENR